jgi:hypothetical protein
MAILKSRFIFLLILILISILLIDCGREKIPGQNCPEPRDEDVYLEAALDGEKFVGEKGKITCNYRPPFLVIGAVNEREPNRAPQILQMRINNFLGQPGVYLFNAEGNYASYADNYLGEHFTNSTFTGTLTALKVSECFLEGVFQFEAQHTNGIGIMRIANGKYKVAINK